MGLILPPLCGILTAGAVLAMSLAWIRASEAEREESPKPPRESR